MGVREEDDEKQKNHLCKVARLICEVESLKAENEALKTTITQLSLKLDEKDHAAEQYHIDLQAGQVELTSLKTKLDSYSHNEQELINICNDEHKKTKKELQTKIESTEMMSSQIVMLEENLSMMKKSEEELEKSNKDLNKEKNNLMETLFLKNKSMEKLSEDLNNSILLKNDMENRLQEKIRSLEDENERLSLEACKVEEFRNECHILTTHLEKENLNKLASRKELEILENRIRKLECEKNSYHEKYWKTKENLTRKHKRLMETCKKTNQHLETHKTTADRLRAQLTESRHLLSMENQKSSDSLRTFLSNFELIFNSSINVPVTHPVNSVISPDDSKQIFEDILSRMKDFLVFHESYKRDQNLMNHNLITQTEHLTNEMKKSKSELLNKEEIIQRLRKSSTEKAEESKKVITKLETKLQDAEERLREVKFQYEMKINECAKQTKLLRTESDKKSAAISRLLDKYNKEMRTMFDTQEVLAEQARAEREEMLILKKKTTNLEQDIDDLKELLKESHSREEQSRNMLKEKHEMLETITGQLETSKYLLSASKQDVEALKEQYSATKLLLETSEMLKNQMKPLNGQNANINQSAPVQEKSNLLTEIT